MNKLTSIFWALLILFCGCSTFEESITETTNEDLKDLYASFEEDTRTYVENNKYLCWHEDDRLTIFYGNTLNRQYKFNGAAGDNSGPFSFVPSEELGADNAFNKIYALYPYNPDVCITEEGVITLTLPAEQTYAENSFGRGANTMLAVTENLEDTSLSFKNACGYLKLKLYNSKGVTIKSIEVKGNNDEKIAGATTATIAFGEVPELTLSDDASTSVTLNCGKGVTLGTTADTATEFWIVLPVTTFAEGLTITATATDGKIFEKSTTKEVIIERNVIQPMAALEVEPDVPKNAKILYTSSDGKVVAPYNANGFGATIISNTYIDGKGVITFDGDVTMIGNNAFYQKKTLTAITLPNSVTTIGEEAFYNCKSLTNVTIGDSVTSIGESAFYGTHLTSVNITDVAAWCDISFDGYYANPLYSADNLYVNEELITDLVIPDGVTTIGNYAFYNCDSFASVTIGDSVTAIGSYAFYKCSGLTSLNGDNSVTTIGNYAFYNCSSLINAPMGDGITTIGDYAFAYCSSLTNVTIGDSVTSIGEGALAYCSSLTSVTIPDSVTTIGSHAFSDCTNLQEFKGKFASYDGRCLIIDGVLNSSAPYDLTEYYIPDGVTSIGDYAFENCTSLTYISIPESVTSIGNSAFNQCKRLSNVFCYATVPPSLGTMAFDDNANGRRIFVYEDSVEPYKSAWSRYQGIIYTNGERCSYVTEIKYTTNDGRTLTTSKLPVVKNIYENGVGTLYISGKQIAIPRLAFSSCISLTSIIIPNNVTMIGVDAFAGCSSLTSITLGNSVTSIGERAFSACKSLTSITIPDSVTTIGAQAFLSCNGLTSITFGNGLTSIGDHAFQNCKSLTNVNITDVAAWCDISIYDVAASPFYYGAAYGTANLYVNGELITDLVIPDGVTTIGRHAFAYCDSFTSVTIGDSVTTIGNYAFEGCNSLTNVTIGDSVRTIGDGAFKGCSSLISVTIPDSVTIIGGNSFAFCSSIANVTIGDSVTTIGGAAFNKCSSLTSVTIGDSVTAIGYLAFQSCSSLTSIIIPDSVTSIGEGAFYDCSSLTSAYCKAITPPTLANSIFSTSTTDRKIYVPRDSVNAYKSATGWKEYAGDIFGYDF